MTDDPLRIFVPGFSDDSADVKAREVIDAWRDEWHLEPEPELDSGNSRVYESLVNHVANALRAASSPVSPSLKVEEVAAGEQLKQTIERVIHKQHLGRTHAPKYCCPEDEPFYDRQLVQMLVEALTATTPVTPSDAARKAAAEIWQSQCCVHTAHPPLGKKRLEGIISRYLPVPVEEGDEAHAQNPDAFCLVCKNHPCRLIGGEPRDDLTDLQRQ